MPCQPECAKSKPQLNSRPALTKAYSSMYSSKSPQKPVHVNSSGVSKQKPETQPRHPYQKEVACVSARKGTDAKFVWPPPTATYHVQIETSKPLKEQMVPSLSLAPHDLRCARPPRCLNSNRTNPESIARNGSQRKTGEPFKFSPPKNHLC